jgi:hypothetical protein
MKDDPPGLAVVVSAPAAQARKDISQGERVLVHQRGMGNERLWKSGEEGQEALQLQSDCQEVESGEATQCSGFI